MVTYSNPGPLEFDGVIMRSDVRGASSYVRFPFDVKQLFGVAGRVPITARIDDQPYRGSLTSQRGPHLVLILKEIQDALGKGPGDSVHIVLELDTTERTVELAADVADGLQEAGALDRFRTLSYSHQREYALWIESAKRAETRASRIAKAAAMVLAGERLK